MGKIKTITPLHIANGIDYFSFTVYDKRRYSLETMLDTIENKELLLDENHLSKLSNKSYVSQMSNTEFFKLFQIRSQLVDPNNALYEVDYLHYRPGKVMECEKTCNKLYIPGSTLKGYIINLAWYDIVNEDKDIHDYLSHNIRDIRKIQERVCPIQQVLICRDVIFDNVIPYLHNCNRFSNKSQTSIPVGVIETINYNVVKENVEIVAKNNNEMLEQFKIIKSSIVHNLSNIERKIVEELYKRLTNLNNWFRDANKGFVILNIDEELDFLDRINNNKINKNTLKKLYENIINELEKGKLIIRLGKYTNYYYKTMSTAFDDFEKQYKLLYTPTSKKKNPEIKSMNIIENRNGLFDIVPGFVEIEL